MRASAADEVPPRVAAAAAQLMEYITNHFIPTLKDTEDASLAACVSRLQTYIGGRQWLVEPKGRKMPRCAMRSPALVARARRVGTRLPDPRSRIRARRSTVALQDRRELRHQGLRAVTNTPCTIRATVTLYLASSLASKATAPGAARWQPNAVDPHKGILSVLQMEGERSRTELVPHGANALLPSADDRPVRVAGV